MCSSACGLAHDIPLLVLPSLHSGILLSVVQSGSKLHLM